MASKAAEIPVVVVIAVETTRFSKRNFRIRIRLRLRSTCHPSTSFYRSSNNNRIETITKTFRMFLKRSNLAGIPVREGIKLTTLSSKRVSLATISQVRHRLEQISLSGFRYKVKKLIYNKISMRRNLHRIVTLQLSNNSRSLRYRIKSPGCNPDGTPKQLFRALSTPQEAEVCSRKVFFWTLATAGSKVLRLKSMFLHTRNKSVLTPILIRQTPSWWIIVLNSSKIRFLRFSSW